MQSIVCACKSRKFAVSVQCKNPAKALPIGIVGSLVVVTTFYILASLTLTLMQPVSAIDPNAGAQ
jgi:amino acid transporter